MRIALLFMFLFTAHAISAQDTIGSIKIKKTIAAGSLSGTYRMTFKPIRANKGKSTAQKTEPVYTTFLLETGQYRIVQNSGTEWTGKWEHKDGIIRLHPTKRSMKKGSEQLPQYCKEWRITDLTGDAMMIECTYKTNEGKNVELEVRMVRVNL